MCDVNRNPFSIPYNSMKKLLFIGFCKFCGEGAVGIRISASGKSVFGMCDECDAVYPDKKMDNPPLFLEQPYLPNPVDGTSLAEEPAHWASLEEARHFGWGDVVIREVEAL